MAEDDTRDEKNREQGGPERRPRSDRWSRPERDERRGPQRDRDGAPRQGGRGSGVSGEDRRGSGERGRDRGGRGRDAVRGRDERSGGRDGFRGGPRGDGPRDGFRGGDRSGAGGPRGRGADYRGDRGNYRGERSTDSRQDDRGYGRGRDDRGRDDRGRSGREEPRAYRGGQGRDAEIRGPRAWNRSRVGAQPEPGVRRREPEIPEGVTGKELDRAVWQQLRTLSKENAEGVAQHLATAAMLLDEDPDRALDHAQHAVRRAGRVPAAREALGLVLYRMGEFAEALREFRTARRLSGSNHLVPYMVDCERGLGRPERALELAASDEAKGLAEADNIELAIVISGVRRDLGQLDAAVMGLRIPALTKASKQPWAARLFYAYADALLATGDESGAHEWFSKALGADSIGETDASDRLAELEGFTVEDLLEDEDEAPFEGEAGGGSSSTPPAEDHPHPQS